MTVTTFQTIIDELERMGPATTVSEKRARLAQMRERLVRLHHAGHSWSAIARALTGSGEKVNVQMLRVICRPKSRRKARARAGGTLPAPPASPNPGGAHHE